MIWASYMDATYGGPVHGKGFCFPAGIMPAYNLPDAEGNARLPCNCAPLYKWYLEPLMSEEQKYDMFLSRYGFLTYIDISHMIPLDRRNRHKSLQAVADRSH